LRRLAEMADGSPLALVELCREVVAQGLLRPGPGGGHYLAAEELDRLPRSPGVEWMAGRELGRLTPELAELARVCAALVPGFDAAEVDAVCRALQGGRAAADTGVGLFQLRARGLLVGDGEGRYAVASAALRSGIERASAPEEVARIHRAALDHVRRAGP